ncbi:hypothetical protein BGZ73_007338, partial [Actinomortierella ambigua]
MPADIQRSFEEVMRHDDGEFVGLVCDTILYEWARVCTYDNEEDLSTGLVKVEYASFAKWFHVAIETCVKFRRFFQGYYFDKLLQATGLQDPLKVQSRFGVDGLTFYDFFPLYEEDEDWMDTDIAFDSHAFMIPSMSSSSTSDGFDTDETKFLYSYSLLQDEKYQQITALIISALLKKWDSNVLDREPTEMFMGHKVLYRLMPSYSKVLRKAYQSRGTIKPPTPLEAYDIARAAEEEKLLTKALAGMGLNGTAASPAGPPPMYDLFGVNASLKRVDFDASSWPRVTQLATQYYHEAKSSHKAETQRADLIRRVQTMLNFEFPGYSLKIEAFGSAAIGLGSENSDLDLCITTPHFERNAPYNNMMTLARLFAYRKMRKVVPVAHARVPIVKFEDPTTRIKVDINCNHVLGVHNSQLIKTYMHIDARLPQILYVLKALIKIHGIHDSSQGLLSSYTIVMMAIAFFQMQNILPNLQDQAIESMTPMHVQLDHDGRGGHDLINCTFDRDWRKYERYGIRNAKSVGQLLFEFFEFFARDFNYPEWEVNIRRGGICARGGQPLALRGGTVNGNSSSSSNGGSEPKSLAPLNVPKKRGQKRAEFVVMDPFLRQRNVAATCQARNLPRVWAVFDHLYQLFAKGDWYGAMTPPQATLPATTAESANGKSKKNRRRMNKGVHEPQHPQQQTSAAFASPPDRVNRTAEEYIPAPHLDSGYIEVEPRPSNRVHGTFASSSSSAARYNPAPEINIGYIGVEPMPSDRATAASSQRPRQTAP